jgi:magnesium transporter
MRVGMTNGFILGLLSFIFIGLYIWLFKTRPVHQAYAISACIGFSLMVAMIVSSFTGTIIPIGFKKLGIDPAVASGPLITTVNDLVAVVTYYGLTWILLIGVLNIVG